MVEAQIYTIGDEGYFLADEIVDVLGEVFVHQLGFPCTYGPEKIPDGQDKSVIRTVIRFNGIDCFEE